MSPFIPAAERIKRAQAIVQSAYEVPVPEHGGKSNFSYIAQVKALLQDARDLVKFIPMTSTATPEMKEQIKQIYADAEKANSEILKWH